MCEAKLCASASSGGAGQWFLLLRVTPNQCDGGFWMQTQLKLQSEVTSQSELVLKSCLWEEWVTTATAEMISH